MRKEPFLINSPRDLKSYPKETLPLVCADLREQTIDLVSRYGGHLGSSLGVVELTVALHYVFNAPEDKIIWDVGHQAYPHKLLTGRRGLFYTNRRLHGISGFPVRSESEYDAFGTGHSSTSISAILGMAMAAKLNGQTERQHVAVIGDGALTGGMAFEALNNLGYEDANVLVILNDNKMSIDKNTGALSQYLVQLTSSGFYNQWKSRTKQFILKTSHKGRSLKTLKKIEKVLKNGVLPSGNFFESLGVRYFGTIDGHDVTALVNVLSNLKKIKGAKLLHVRTVKGNGFEPATNDVVTWHAPGRFNKATGLLEQDAKRKVTFQQVFGETLLDLAQKNNHIVAITPAMLTGSALIKMKERLPERVFDVGIAEQHAVTFAAGLAASGKLPFCTIYSTFLQRAYDQVIHDVVLQKLPVVFCIDRAGVVGADGPTHHGAFDIAFLRCLPEIVCAAPMDLDELRNLLYMAQLDGRDFPLAIRYPRGKSTRPLIKLAYENVQIGTGRLIRAGRDIAILSLGVVGQYATAACELLERDGIVAAHYDLRFFKPLDEQLLHEVFRQYRMIITVEDGCIIGGVGTAIIAFAHEQHYFATIKCLGLPDTFAPQGTQEELHALFGYDTKGIVSEAKRLIGKN
ncbi:1-deoxy-D-xylulose-5-phosphate synthase [Parapedobacter sp. GCM10030251]|uniref:1-deoxy-D-xylulose-5-phosphate synthase n=1 Tax=Parapedobacter sp. GCM10030251 TaxID=3273419 RepID=UPI00360745FD